MSQFEFTLLWNLNAYLFSNPDRQKRVLRHAEDNIVIEGGFNDTISSEQEIPTQPSKHFKLSCTLPGLSKPA